MRSGRIAAELSGDDITAEKIRFASYAEAKEDAGAQVDGSAPMTGENAGLSATVGALRTAAKAIRSSRAIPQIVGSRLVLAAILLAGVVGGIAIANPTALSATGLDLLLPTVLPLAFATLAQMFIILSGGFDVGIGYAVGLSNVLAATLLVDHAGLGVIALLGIVAAYGLMGATTQLTGVPAVVITLGASFVWLGVGLVIQPNPGGVVPNWLFQGLSQSLPTVPEPVYIVVALGIVSYLLLYRSRRGLLMRAFGNNRRAYVDSGWSPLAVVVLLYLLAGICVVLSGLMVTVVNTASDINASATLTLASVAAVVVGGAELTRGFVAPVGAVMAAVAFGLLPSLMAFTNVRAEYVPAVEGLLIIAAMMLRWLSRQALSSSSSA